MHTAYIGMGANLPGPAGPPEATLAAAVQRLEQLGRVTARSRLYSTAPIGIADQPRFVNAAVALETALSPRELLGALLAIEHEFGRDRSREVRNGPRTLDLDILLFGDVAVNEPDLEIPHPRLAERAFALLPLCEISPGARDPRTGETVAQCLQRLSPGPPDAVQSVTPIQSDFWRSGDVGGPVAGVR